MKILNVVGARPNFMKVAPLHRAFSRRSGVVSMIVHTGQHHHVRMSDIFFKQLELPQPDFFLGVSGGTHTQQIARIMLAFEQVLMQERPDRVVVVGDVNSTLACALAAVQSGIPVAHVEAGLRSGDPEMPEETNRILTDRLSDLLFVTEQAGVDNLIKEGIPQERVHLVGNVMIDTLVSNLEKSQKHGNLQLPGSYVLMTMHRPSNVDQLEGLLAITDIMEKVAAHKRIVFPVHPHTEKAVREHGLWEKWRNIPGLTLLEPQGYLEFLNLMQHAFLVVTDSGGVQEETTYLGVPCFTFRKTTERPVTVTLGANELFSELDPEKVYARFLELLAGRGKRSVIPPLWDGKAAERIASILLGEE
jgi:UDP-N-acetylglucosamine 2-epimerase (non-hydrolysing)